MSYSRKVASNTIVQILGRVLSTGVAVFIVGILTHKLGVSGYGEYSIVFAYLGLYSVLADFGLFYLLIRKLSAKEGDPNEVTSNLITMRVVAALVIYGISAIIILFLPYTNSVKQAALIATIAFFAASIQNTIFGIFQSYYQMQWVVVTDIIGKVIVLALIYYFSLTHLSLYLAMLAYVIGNVTATIFVTWRARKIIPFQFGFKFDLWRSIFKESIYFSIAIVFTYLYFKVDVLMLSIMKGSTEVGIYAVGVKVLEVIIIFPQMFIGTILPIYSRYIANKDTRLEDTIQKTFDILAFFMAGVVGGVFVLAPQIIKLIAGQSYLKASTLTLFNNPVTSATVLSIIIFTAIFSYLTPTFNQLLIAGGKQKMLVWPNVLFLVFNFILNLIFIPKYSYVAACLTTLLTEFLILITISYIAHREFQFKVSYLRLAKCIVAGALMVLVLKLMSLPLLFMVLIGGVSYLIFAYILGAIRPEVFHLLKKKTA